MEMTVDFVLTLGEHEWTEAQLEDLEAAQVEAMRRVREGGWREASAGEAEALGSPEAALNSLERYREVARAQLAAIIKDAPFAEDVIAAVCERAADLVRSRGGEVRAGWVRPFETNSNDTTFLLRLSAPA